MRDERHLSWTQPQCMFCWGRNHPGRVPYTLKGAPLETCCTCGGQTEAGVYIRIDPLDAPYPTLEKDDWRDGD